MSAQMNQLLFRKLDPRAVLPVRGSAAAAGLDLFAIEDLAIEPHSRVVARTGLAVAIPEGYYGRVAPRSGLAKNFGLDVLAGVIDADYRGEIGCLLYNTGAERVQIAAGSKICQLIIERIITPEAAWVSALANTDRGDGGFGSTG
jgi:dUTP pyrophosphatase